MRAFLGISVQPSLKPRIVHILDALDQFDVKQVEKDNLHFNLKFFKDIENDKIDQLKRAVEDVCGQASPFEIEIHGMGAFPSRSFVRVLWLGVRKGYDKFKVLGEALDSALLASLGTEKEEKFVPHMTLGRVRSGSNSNELLIFLRNYENIEVGSMMVDKITLFQSKLSPNGPVYEEVFSVKI
ncbi:MAG: RNA 2',3'-cyclic phosphodiesterase [Candidatus Aenigmatarchaeota archaeon]